MALDERTMIVECPRCQKQWHVPLGQTEVDCNCHLICPDGTTPNDCAVTTAGYTGSLGWPSGLDTGSLDEGDDVLNRTYYCLNHSRYYYKTPIILEADWNKWLITRAPKRFRMGRGEY